MTPDDLVTWLRAQLDEDERVAQAAIPGPWVADGDEVLHDGDQVVLSGHSTEHVARHDPVRVLAEMEAKRELIAVYEEAAEYYDKIDRRAPAGEAHGLRTALKHLALPYADREGYREEWRP